MPATGKLSFILRWLASVLIVIGLVAADLVIAPIPAFAQSAQEQPRGGGLFRGLFMRRDPVARPERVEQVEQRVRPKRQRQAKRQQPRRKKARAAAAAPRPEPQATQKLDDARTVLVVGDFLGGGLAEGLETAFAETPGLRVVDRTNGSSGFVRDDFYDWPAEIGPMLDAEKPAAVVMMIGSNDRQQIRVDGSSQPVLSPKWTAEYQSRIGEFTDAVTQKGIPLVWVGMPAFKSNSMTSDMLAFNDLFRQAVEGTTGGVFVDIWDGFVDENGGFSVRGPDVNGQPVQLRSRDGINLTRDGRRKVAFYVEKPLARILGEQPASEDAVASVSGEMGPPIPPDLLGGPAVALPEVNRTMPISLSDPELDGGAELLGATSPSPATTPSERPVAEGVAPPPPGRADNFMMRQTSPAAADPVASGG